MDQRLVARDVALDPPTAGSADGRPLAARSWQRSALTAVLLVAAIVWLIPAVWVLVTSLKTTESIIRLPPEWIPIPATLQHYREALFSSRTANVGRAFLNSAVVGIATVALVLACCALAAYPLARMRFPGRDLTFAILVGSLMVPGVITIVPLYLQMQQLGWLSTYQVLIVPDTALTFGFGVFLLRQFFQALPLELEEAARIDGANSWQIFMSILIPLSQPALAALAIFAFRSSWNDFIWPLISINKPEMFTLPVALALLRSNYASESYGPIMAGAVLSAVPIVAVFVIANRRIIEGVQFSGLKG